MWGMSMNILLSILVSLLFGYLLGSRSNGVLIGKIFFGVDVRTMGSGNSGGTNTGRVLGKGVGLITILLDVLKTIVSIWGVYFIAQIPEVNAIIGISPSILAYVSGFGACLGHMFPLYFNFQGGKVVSCFAGLVLASNWILIIIGFVAFMIVLFISKYVSLSSILASSLVGILSFIPLFTENGMIFNLEGNNIYYSLLLTISAIILIIRHIPNIQRLLNNTESKVTWLGK